jgi:3-hydroxybutyryl-CoA dehydrogenase
MEKIAVVGAGMMGQGIAEAFAAKGFPVALYARRKEALDQVHEKARADFKNFGVDEKAAENISLHNTLAEAVGDAELVIENVAENLEVKQNMFVELEKYARPDCILASNTSVMPITKIGAKANSRNRMLGTHWWNPPFLIPLVEVVQTEFTELQYVERAIRILKSAGKVAVHCKRDVAGFIANRMQHALWREAVSIVERGICDAETVDLCVKNSFGFRLPVLAPLENADLVGLDLTLAIHNTILAEIEDSHQPSPYLIDKVNKGELGMKSGQGFYSWTSESAQAVRDRLAAYLREATARNRRP